MYTTIPIPIWKSSLLISYFPFIFFRYTWQKNGKPYDWQVYDDRILQQPGRGTLVITSPRDEDIGKSKQIIKKLVPMKSKMIRPIMTTIRKVLKIKFESIYNNLSYSLRLWTTSGFLPGLSKFFKLYKVLLLEKVWNLQKKCIEKFQQN